MKLWQAGDLDSLLQEGLAIQRSLASPSARSKNAGDDSARKGFTRLMLLGNVKGALRCLSNQGKGGVLPLNADCGDGRTTLDALKEKHPPACPIPDADVLLQGPIAQLQVVQFASID
eukprot:scpid113076/ scgid14416/ 